VKGEQRLWVSPPNWPPPGEGWQPPVGWRPDPSWPPAPRDWQFWQSAKGGRDLAADPTSEPTDSVETSSDGTWHGWDGDVTIGGDTLSIIRNAPGKMRGKGSGTRRIPLSAISSVTFFSATRILEGAIALGLGGRPAATNLKGALRHFDAVTFRRKNQAAFQALQERLTKVVADNLELGVDFALVDFDLNPDTEQRQEGQHGTQDDIVNYGRLIANAMFGMRTVRIYDNGFVRVSAPLRGSAARFERLISIESSSDVSKKSGAGRTAGAVVTMGLNLAGSNKRGDVYLTITTDSRTYVLHEDPPTASNMKTAKALEAVGLGVLSRRSSEQADPKFKTVENQRLPKDPSTAGRLRELSDLQTQGLITQAEYDQQRTRLLGEL
jgi:hypothetical protein